MKKIFLFLKTFYQLLSYSKSDFRLKKGLVFGRSWWPLMPGARFLIFWFGKNNYNNIMMHARGLSLQDKDQSQEGAIGTFNFTRYLERDLLKMVVDFLKLPFTKFSGYVTSGATEANIYALWIAREWALSRNNGEKIFWIIPKNVHYSIKKALKILGIFDSSDMHTVCYVELDDLGRASLKHLKQLIINNRKKITILVLTAISTEFGSLDPIHQVDKFLCKFKFDNIFFHIDAAFSGFLLPLSDNYRNIFNLRSLYSITVDFHKNLAGPVGCGGIVFRAGLESLVKVNANYLSTNADYTLIGSRKGVDIIAVWSIIQMNDYAILRKKFISIINKTKYFYYHLSHIPYIRILYKPNFNYIVFSLTCKNNEFENKIILLLQNFSITSSSVLLNNKKINLFKIIVRNDQSFRKIDKFVRILRFHL